MDVLEHRSNPYSVRRTFVVDGIFDEGACTCEEVYEPSIQTSVLECDIVSDV